MNSGVAGIDGGDFGVYTILELTKLAFPKGPAVVEVPPGFWEAREYSMERCDYVNVLCERTCDQRFFRL